MESSSRPFDLKKVLNFTIILFAVLFFIEWPGSWLFDPDEARYAEIPQSMVASGDYLTPRLNGSNYFEKPPLLYWLNALSIKTFGSTPFTARFPSRLATLGTALLLILAFKKPAPTANLWAALVYLSSLLPFAIGRINLTDSILSFGLTLTFLSMHKLLIVHDEGVAQANSVFFLWGGAAIAVMAKGLVGVVLPVIVFLAWGFMMGQWKRIPQIIFSKGAILFLLVTSPWFILMELKHPGFLEIFFVREHVLRYLTDGADRPGSIFYFVPILFLGLLPWTFYFISSTRCLMTTKLEEIRKHPNELFLGVWILVIFFFFSFSRSKLIPYLLPAFPAASSLIGIYLAQNKPDQRILRWTLACWSCVAVGALVLGIRIDIIDRYDVWPQALIIFALPVTGNIIALWRQKKRILEGPVWMALGWLGCYVALISVIPVLARDYSLHDLATKAAEAKADRVIAFKTFPHSFPLIFKKPIPVVQYKGELASDGELSSALFLQEDQFWKSWNSKERIVAILRKNTRALFKAQVSRGFYLGENRKFVLLANFDLKDQTADTTSRARTL